MSNFKFCCNCEKYDRMRIRVCGEYEWAQYGRCKKDCTVEYTVITPCDGYCDDWEDKDEKNSNGCKLGGGICSADH